ncbi:hypothetical protein ACFORL_12375 [Legionella dresdenensis]|uniref:Uncharacterized protein n=1 Tax=Legionella dresdenensis TaxID=450200 RepID=A0ABV8CIC6_9GAMM
MTLPNSNKTQDLQTLGQIKELLENCAKEETSDYTALFYKIAELTKTITYNDRSSDCIRNKYGSVDRSKSAKTRVEGIDFISLAVISRIDCNDNFFQSALPELKTEFQQLAEKIGLIIAEEEKTATSKNAWLQIPAARQLSSIIKYYHIPGVVNRLINLCTDEKLALLNCKHREQRYALGRVLTKIGESCKEFFDFNPLPPNPKGSKKQPQKTILKEFKEIRDTFGHTYAVMYYDHNEKELNELRDLIQTLLLPELKKIDDQLKTNAAQQNFNTLTLNEISSEKEKQLTKIKASFVSHEKTGTKDKPTQASESAAKAKPVRVWEHVREFAGLKKQVEKWEQNSPKRTPAKNAPFLKNLQDNVVNWNKHCLEELKITSEIPTIQLIAELEVKLNKIFPPTVTPAPAAPAVETLAQTSKPANNGLEIQYRQYQSRLNHLERELDYLETLLKKSADSRFFHDAVEFSLAKAGQLIRDIREINQKLLDADAPRKTLESMFKTVHLRNMLMHELSSEKQFNELEHALLRVVLPIKEEIQALQVKSSATQVTPEEKRTLAKAYLVLEKFDEAEKLYNEAFTALCPEQVDIQQMNPEAFSILFDLFRLYARHEEVAKREQDDNILTEILQKKREMFKKLIKITDVPTDHVPDAIVREYMVLFMCNVLYTLKDPETAIMNDEVPYLELINAVLEDHILSSKIQSACVNFTHGLAIYNLAKKSRSAQLIKERIQQSQVPLTAIHLATDLTFHYYLPRVRVGAALMYSAAFLLRLAPEGGERSPALDALYLAILNNLTPALLDSHDPACILYAPEIHNELTQLMRKHIARSDDSIIKPFMQPEEFHQLYSQAVATCKDLQRFQAEHGNNIGLAMHFITIEYGLKKSDDELTDALLDFKDSANYPLFLEIKAQYQLITGSEVLFKQDNINDYDCIPITTVETHEKIVRKMLADLECAELTKAHYERKGLLLYTLSRLITILAEHYKQDRNDEIFAYIKQSLESYYKGTFTKSTFSLVSDLALFIVSNQGYQGLKSVQQYLEKFQRECKVRKTDHFKAMYPIELVLCFVYNKSGIKKKEAEQYYKHADKDNRTLVRKRVLNELQEALNRFGKSAQDKARLSNNRHATYSSLKTSPDKAQKAACSSSAGPRR